MCGASYKYHSMWYFMFYGRHPGRAAGRGGPGDPARRVPPVEHDDQRGQRPVDQEREQARVPLGRPEERVEPAHRKHRRDQVDDEVGGDQAADPAHRQGRHLAVTSQPKGPGHDDRHPEDGQFGQAEGVSFPWVEDQRGQGGSDDNDDPRRVVEPVPGRPRHWTGGRQPVVGTTLTALCRRSACSAASAPSTRRNRRRRR